jgi:hypothetical protein
MRYHCGPPRAQRVLMLSLAGTWPVILSMPVLTPTTGKGEAAGAGAEWTPAHERAEMMQIDVLHIVTVDIRRCRGSCRA